MRNPFRRRNPPPRCMDCPAPATVAILMNGMPAGWFCDEHDQASRDLHAAITARLKDAADQLLGDPENWKPTGLRNASPAPVIVPPADPPHDPATCGMCRPRPRR
jgi:hypothetical protein